MVGGAGRHIAGSNGPSRTNKPSSNYREFDILHAGAGPGATFSIPVLSGTCIDGLTIRLTD